MTHSRLCLFVITSSLLTNPALSMGQAAAVPAPCSEDTMTRTVNSVNSAATTASKDTTTLANAGTDLNAAQQKFNTMLSGWRGKPKTAANTTTPSAATTASSSTSAIQMAELARANNTTAAAPAKPCAPAKPIPAKSAAAGAPAPPAFTLRPDGDYMLAYTGAEAGAQPSYAKVKRISAAPSPAAANPQDGVYTDGRSYYMVTGGKLTVTPMGGPAAR